MEITKQMKRRYQLQAAGRTLLFALLYLAFWFGIMYPLLFQYMGVNIWVGVFAFIVLNIIYNIFITRRLVKLIWRNKIVITQEQYEALGGRAYIEPPEKFRDIFKYSGELDFDYAISEYKGFRVISCFETWDTWSENKTYTVYFLREADAILFKLSCV